MKTYFVRHGYTDSNHAIWGNQEEIRAHFPYDEKNPLNRKYGVPQVQEMAGFMSEELKGKRVLLLVSPYKRAVQTAGFIANALGGADVKVVKSLREINAGLEYGTTIREKRELAVDYPEMFRYEEDGKLARHDVYEPFVQGESMVELTRRVRKGVLPHLEEVNPQDYDAVVVVAHGIVNRCLIKLLTGKDIGGQQKTASVVDLDDPTKAIFEPSISVPQDYKIDFDDYVMFDDGSVEYSDVVEFHKLMEEHKEQKLFKKFFKGSSTAELDGTSVRVEGKGSTLLLPKVGSPNEQMVYIDCKLGKENVTSDKKSKSTYYILSGKGYFVIDGEEIRVTAGDVIEVLPNQVCDYNGVMKIIERMEPAFAPENVTIHQEKTFTTNQSIFE